MRKNLGNIKAFVRTYTRESILKVIKNIQKIIYFLNQAKTQRKVEIPILVLPGNCTQMARETLGLIGVLGTDFSAKSLSLFGKAFAGIASHGQVLFSRI